MVFDILTVFTLSIISSLFLCSTSIHGLPPSLSTELQYIHKTPNADLTSSFRILRIPSVPNVENDSTGGSDSSQMSIGESSNEDDDDNDSISVSPINKSNVPLEYYSEPTVLSKYLTRKFLSLNKQKRSMLTTKQQLNGNPFAAKFADSSHNINKINGIRETIRLSPALKDLIEKNQIARAWLIMLLQKLMQEQQVPYIFKYGRRRK